MPREVCSRQKAACRQSIVCNIKNAVAVRGQTNRNFSKVKAINLILLVPFIRIRIWSLIILFPLKESRIKVVKICPKTILKVQIILGWGVGSRFFPRRFPKTKQGGLSLGSVQAETVRLSRQIEPTLMDIHLRFTEFCSQE